MILDPGWLFGGILWVIPGGFLIHDSIIKSLEVTKFALSCLCLSHLAQALFLQNNQALQNGFLISL